jgi:hypothetical protein
VAVNQVVALHRWEQRTCIGGCRSWLQRLYGNIKSLLNVLVQHSQGDARLDTILRFIEQLFRGRTALLTSGWLIDGGKWC